MAVSSIMMFTNPVAAWNSIATDKTRLLRHFATHTIPWALVPAICWYIGITTVGWKIGQEPNQKMAAESALFICTLFVGSSRVDLQACKLEYSIVSPK